MKSQFKKNILALALIPFVSGCSFIQERDILEEKTESASQVIKKMDEYVSNLNLEADEQVYLNYQVRTEQGDLDLYTGAKKSLDISLSKSAAVYDVLQELAGQLGVGVIYDLESPQVLVGNLNIPSLKGSLSGVISTLEKSMDLDIYFTEEGMVVSDSISLSGNFSKLEKGEETSQVYGNLKSYLSELLNAPADTDSSNIEEGAGSAKKIVEVAGRTDILPENSVVSEVKPTILIDDSTGSFYIKARPNLLRNSSSMIENVINSASSYAMIKLEIYKIDDSRARELGVSAERIIDNLYSLAVSAPSTEVNPIVLFEKQLDTSNSLRLGISAYERTGVVRSEDSLVLTVFNGVSSQYSNTEESGYWVPGELTEQTQTTNGVIQTVYKESKPTYTPRETGKVMEITPRINLENRVINLSINYTDSKVVGYDVTTWQRQVDLEPVEMKIALIGENKVKGVLQLKEGSYGVLSGSKGKQGEVYQRTLPGASGTALENLGVNGSVSKKSSNFILAKPILPTVKQVEIIKKIKVK